MKVINSRDIVKKKSDIKTAVIAVTENGKAIADRLSEKIKTDDIFFQRRGIKELTGELFKNYDCIIFICACGIAVRCIAPYIKSKFEDPAVIVVDDMGKNAISLLSGHIGGANEITKEISEILGGNAVITTATDVSDKGALDVIASEIGVYIKNIRDSVKMVNSAVVNGKKAAIYFDEPYRSHEKKLNLSGFDVIDDIVDGYKITDKNDEINSNTDKYKDNEYIKEDFSGNSTDNKGSFYDNSSLLEIILKYDIIVYISDRMNDKIDDIKKYIYEVRGKEINAVKLIPRRIVLGAGCKKNTDYMNMENEFMEFCRKENIAAEAVCRIGSIDLKKDETALINLSKSLCAEFTTFTKEQISEFDYIYDKSEFVKKITGVYSVSGPSAHILSDGNVISETSRKNGITLTFGRIKKDI